MNLRSTWTRVLIVLAVVLIVSLILNWSDFKDGVVAGLNSF